MKSAILIWRAEHSTQESDGQGELWPPMCGSMQDIKQHQHMLCCAALPPARLIPSQKSSSFPAFSHEGAF